MERKLYLGPYFEVRSPKEIERIDRCKKPAECPSPDNGARSNQPDSFCSVCGVELKGRVSEHHRRPDFVEMFSGQPLLQLVDNCGKSPVEDHCGADEDDFITDCLVPNIANAMFERGTFWLDDSVQDMTDIMVGNETQWMRKKFKPQLLELFDKFGEPNVKTRWGFLSYWD